MDVKESSHPGGAASELLGSFALFALTLCCNITNILVVGFLSKPDRKLTLVGPVPRRIGDLHLEDMVGMRVT